MLVFREDYGQTRNAASEEMRNKRIQCYSVNNTFYSYRAASGCTRLTVIESTFFTNAVVAVAKRNAEARLRLIDSRETTNAWFL